MQIIESRSALCNLGADLSLIYQFEDVRALIAEWLKPDGPTEVAPHPSSGRNRIYVVEVVERQQTLLVKFLDSLPGDVPIREPELLAYLGEVSDCVPEISFISTEPAAHATVMSRQAVTLAELSPAGDDRPPFGPRRIPRCPSLLRAKFSRARAARH
jgi:hypothetical protein